MAKVAKIRYLATRLPKILIIEQPQSEVMTDTSIQIDLSKYPKMHSGQAASPFRYPGGKGFLSPFLADELSKRFIKGMPAFAEPFCGGAGAALNLLVSQKVDKIYLNDADIKIYSAWVAIINESERFIARINETDANIDNWNSCLNKIYNFDGNKYDFELGFASFFVNRTSRSGVLIGSGPIGGYTQDGTWKIGARYYKESLIRRINSISHLKDRIIVSNLDGVDFCEKISFNGNAKETFVFIDPPYVKAGGRLYHQGMNATSHRKLSDWLKSGAMPNWLLTYDDHPTVRENYTGLQQYKLNVRYSMAQRRMQEELVYMS